VLAGGIGVHPDDLARGVDAGCNRAGGGRRIVEGSGKSEACDMQMDAALHRTMVDGRPWNTKTVRRLSESVVPPQGGVVSPILSNLFLHYTFDLWMTRTHPDLPWCRYADDGLVHCRSEQEAQALKVELQARLAECRLECIRQRPRSSTARTGVAEERIRTSNSTFSDIAFEPRRVRRSRDNTLFCGFHPAVSSRR